MVISENKVRIIFIFLQASRSQPAIGLKQTAKARVCYSYLDLLNFPLLEETCHLLTTFANSLDPDDKKSLNNYPAFKKLKLSLLSHGVTLLTCCMLDNFQAFKVTFCDGWMSIISSNYCFKGHLLNYWLNFRQTWQI